MQGGSAVGGILSKLTLKICPVHFVKMSVPNNSFPQDFNDLDKRASRYSKNPLMSCIFSKLDTITQTSHTDSELIFNPSYNP